MRGIISGLFLINVPQTLISLYAVRAMHDRGTTGAARVLLVVALICLLTVFALLESTVGQLPRLGVALGIVAPYFLLMIPIADSMTRTGSPMRRIQWTIGLLAIPAGALQVFLTLYTSCYAGYECL